MVTRQTKGQYGNLSQHVEGQHVFVGGIDEMERVVSKFDSPKFNADALEFNRSYTPNHCDDVEHTSIVHPVLSQRCDPRS